MREGGRKARPPSAYCAANAVVARLAITIKAGGYELRGGNDIVGRERGKPLGFDVNRALELRNGSVVTRDIDLRVDTSTSRSSSACPARRRSSSTSCSAGRPTSAPTAPRASRP